MNQKACRTCSTIIFSVFNQSNHRVLVLSLLLPSSLIKVPNTSVACMGRFSYLNGLCRSKVRELNVGAMLFIEEDTACCRNQTNIQTNRYCMRVLQAAFVRIYEWLPINNCKWFRGKELPWISPCKIPTSSCANFKARSKSFPKAAHVFSETYLNSYSTYFLSVPPKNEIPSNNNNSSDEGDYIENNNFNCKGL